MPTVSNTSPISNLACIGRLDLLRDQFSSIWIPEAVQAELDSIPDPAVRQAIEQAQAQGWLELRLTSDAKLVNLLKVELHSGEAEAIALALEMKADRLLIDEREGRVVARQLGLPVTGVLGVLLRAKKTKRLEVIKPDIEALKSRARFFIDPALEAAILQKAGE
jgi:predicted nucleic acid-binding protein